MPFAKKNRICRFRNKASWIFIFFIAAKVAIAQVIYEAESAALSNGARVADCKNCSGNKQVGYVGGDDNGTVTFERVVAPRGGLYPMTVRYNTGDRTFTIVVNTNTRLEAIFPQAPFSKSDDVNLKTVLVPLNEGLNTIAFNNEDEYAPDLDAIVIGDEPVEAGKISGAIKNSNGLPMTNVDVSLLGFGFETKTKTDMQGRYQFPFLPKGDYYVRPKAAGTFFAPYENFCAADETNAEKDFTTRTPGSSSTNISVMQSGKWRIEYDLENGTADVFCNGKILLPKVFAAARAPQSITSLDYKNRKVLQEKIRDNFGIGAKYTVELSNNDADKMIQEFWLYENADYFLTDVKILRKPTVACNFISPLTTQTPVNFLPDGDRRALFVPFDNDKWIRYDARPFGNDVTSYEVSALYENTSRNGLIIGSIEHDNWKTGVKSTTLSNAMTGLEIFGGITSTKTRDVLPHGKISGETIASPKIFVGYFSDWRDGLEAFADANVKIAPPRVWNKGVPFGWNSWGKLQQNISYTKAIQVSDFFARELQPNHFENDGTVYIGLDSGWQKFSNEQLKQFVEHCHANHQEAGIYLAPFAVWHVNDNAPVADTNYKFKDIYLYANGKKQILDGGVALDPTHPGTKRLIETTVARFKKAGFKYVKADFLGHGVLEADKFFDPHVTTGIQAYNEGMKFVEATLGKEIYLNESISPLFPAQYANSRRIACDTFGDIGKIEYTLNALTYGWWLSRVYDFNDADHVVLDGYSEGENRARVTSAIITGIFISGDDFSAGGSVSGKQRAEKFLTNTEIDALARVKKLFRPVEGNTGNRAANLFSFEGKKKFYVAAFNYSDTNMNFDLNLKRAGLVFPGQIVDKELWSGVIADASNFTNINFDQADAVLYRFSK